MSRLLSSLVLGVVYLLVAACGSIGSESEDGDPDYSHLAYAEPQPGPLSNQGDTSEFARYLRNGMRLHYQDTAGPQTDVIALAAERSGASAGGFSRTNVHVEGVDEGDRVKYDGEYLYVAESGGTPIFAERALSDRPRPSVRVLETFPDQAQAMEIAKIELDVDRLSINELYLHEDEQGRTQQLVTLGHEAQSPSQDIARGFMTLPYFPTSGQTRVDLFNVASPEVPQRFWSMELDGRLINSRKVGPILYLVTRHRPEIDGLISRPDTRSEREANERLIASTPLSDLLPSVEVNGERQPLVDQGDCFLPQGIEAHEGYADLLAISAFDVRTQKKMSSVCLNAHVSGLYASPTSLYLGTSFGPWGERQTGIHKFALEAGQIDYQGTGQVPGELNWADPAFSMDEQEGYLRVVTTQRSTAWDGDINHQLTVLRSRKGSDALETVATLPNDGQPKPIGKPGEDIFAVRFLGERAYIVTFERIDPLYVLDLSDNESPRIAGELEVPGFSTYLHPAGEGYLISVGQEADENGMTREMKVELFDVRDMNNPQSVGRHLVGGEHSWSEALRDLHAFNILETESGQLRFTLPVTRWSPDDEARRSGLYLYEINGLPGGEAKLNPVGSLIPGVDDEPLRTGNNRSRLHGDTLFYLHGNRVWSSFWNAPEQANGPL